ncbi:MAG: NADH-quinone oxidoreductase subunit J, partial [Planctomyces sp.]
STTKGSATSPPPLPSPDAPIPPPPPVIPAMLSKATPETPVGSMKGLGRSLFGDYLFAVELAGTILLVASIGAIAIAPRREEGAL